MATYYLRTKKEKGDGVLYAKVRKSNLDKAVEVATGITVDVVQWNKAQKSVKAYDAWKKTENGKKAYELIERVNAVLDIYYDGVNVPDIQDIKKAIADVVQHEAREALRKEEEELMKELEVREEAIRLLKQEEMNDVLKVYEDRIRKMESGEVKSKRGTNYSKGTIYLNKFVLKELREFMNGEVLKWSDIDCDLVNRLVLRLEKKKDGAFFGASINSVIDLFRGFVTSAYNEDIHNEHKYMKAFANKRRVVKDSKVQIYLTAEEVQGLYNMQLKGYQDMVRDVFLVGIYTCQRISDYKELTEDSFGLTAKGNKVVRLRQIKTSKEVVVPVLDDNLMKIAEKRNYQFTKYKGANIDEARFNETLKVICKKLSEEIPSLCTLYETRLTRKEANAACLKADIVKKDGKTYKHKYDMVSSHTARRTGITLLYLSGKFDIYQMMSISGHTQETTFRRYIRLSLDEMADSIIDDKGEEELF